MAIAALLRYLRYTPTTEDLSGWTAQYNRNTRPPGSRHGRRTRPRSGRSPTVARRRPSADALSRGITTRRANATPTGPPASGSGGPGHPPGDPELDRRGLFDGVGRPQSPRDHRRTSAKPPGRSRTHRRTPCEAPGTNRRAASPTAAGIARPAEHRRRARRRPSSAVGRGGRRAVGRWHNGHAPVSLAG
jgi:hypothetical protein